MGKIIWYLHHYAGSPSLGMSYRPYYLAKEFQSLGYRPYVIGASFHHLLHDPKPQDLDIRHEIIDDLNYIWVKVTEYKSNGFKRLGNMFSYGYHLHKHQQAILSLTEKPDVIIVSSSHLLHYPHALKLAKSYGCKIIFEVRDIWPLSLIEIAGKSRLNPLVLYMNRIERLAYKTADAVVSLLSSARSHMEPRGLAPDKFHYIPNGTHVANLTLKKKCRLPSVIEKKIDELKNCKRFLIGYAGAHGIPNALDQFIDALARLQSMGYHQIHGVLIGEGICKQHLIDKATEYQLDNVTFLNQINQDHIHSFLSYMDALFLGWQDKPIYAYGISPNKLFDYMLAAKPIIHASNTSCDPVSEAGCGIILPPEQPETLADGLLSMSKMPLEDLEKLGQNGYDYVIKNHNYARLAQQYCELFK